jgi:hypothetical protein
MLAWRETAEIYIHSGTLYVVRFTVPIHFLDCEEPVGTIYCLGGVDQRLPRVLKACLG